MDILQNIFKETLQRNRHKRTDRYDYDTSREIQIFFVYKFFEMYLNHHVMITFGKILPTKCIIMMFTLWSVIIYIEAMQPEHLPFSSDLIRFPFPSTETTPTTF